MFRTRTASYTQSTISSTPARFFMQTCTFSAIWSLNYPTNILLNIINILIFSLPISNNGNLHMLTNLTTASLIDSMHFLTHWMPVRYGFFSARDESAGDIDGDVVLNEECSLLASLNVAPKSEILREPVNHRFSVASLTCPRPMFNWRWEFLLNSVNFLRQSSFNLSISCFIIHNWMFLLDCLLVFYS